MKKSICILGLLIATLLNSNSLYANEVDNISNYNQTSNSITNRSKDGHFEVVKTKYKLYGYPVKLKDGKVLITMKSRNINLNIIFDPKTNTFRETTPFNENILPYHGGVLLNNGKVLFVGPFDWPPSLEFENKIYWLILDDLEKEKLKKKFYPYNERSMAAREAWQEYSKLPEQEKEKIYLPYFHKDPELLKQYTDYKKHYNASIYAQLYDPKTETFKNTGKLVLRARFMIKTVLLQDGRVFIGHDKHAQIYDPDTETFSLYKLPNEARVDNIICLNDGRIFILTRNLDYLFFNPEDNTFSEPQPFINSPCRIFKLNNGKILVFTGKKDVFKTQNIKDSLGNETNSYYYTWNRYNAIDILLYDPDNDTIAYSGHLAVPRGEFDEFSVNILKDGRVLITGGEKNIEKRKLGDSTICMNDAEIFDPKTGISKVISQKHYKTLRGNSILLDDGRVLFYSDQECELFVPNNK